VLSDSGTVQEECSIFGIPNVTLRDVTERPETMECGSNILSGMDGATILEQVHLVTTLPSDWRQVPEYMEENVSDKIVKILYSMIPIKH
jgi:UDP-N-acetylglucosamine 2-epimerase (non-hydrolysing)